MSNLFLHTLDGKEGLVDLTWQQRFGKIAEELLEDVGNIVDTDFISQDNISSTVKILSELSDSFLTGAHSENANSVEAMKLKVPAKQQRFYL